jgi:hypothetical protein
MPGRAQLPRRRSRLASAGCEPSADSARSLAATAKAAARGMETVNR